MEASPCHGAGSIPTLAARQLWEPQQQGWEEESGVGRRGWLEPAPRITSGDVKILDEVWRSPSNSNIQDLVGKSRSINPPAGDLPPELVGVKLGQWRERVAILGNSPGFDWTVCCIILLNALMIGIQSDYVARTLSEEMPTAFFALEMFLCVAFTMELALRLFVFRLGYFRGRNRAWNCFDLTLVMLQLTENVFLIGSGGSLQNFGFARAARHQDCAPP
jgi:hypothetical protein